MGMKEGLKTCARCGNSQVCSNFHRNRRAKDGLASYCKDCIRRYQRKCEEKKKGCKIERRGKYEKMKRKYSFWKLRIGESCEEVFSPRYPFWQANGYLKKNIRSYRRSTGKDFAVVPIERKGRRVGVAVTRVK